MMDPHELHYDLIEILGEFRKHLANSGDGEWHPKPDDYPIAVQAHQQATALLQTLESDEFEEKVLP